MQSALSIILVYTTLYTQCSSNKYFDRMQRQKQETINYKETWLKCWNIEIRYVM